MRKNTLIESTVITTLLAAVLMATFCSSVSAWTGSDWNFGSSTDGSTWQVSTQVTGYYWNTSQYELVVLEAWRGCIDPVSYSGGLCTRLDLWGPPVGYATSGWIEFGDETGPYSYYYPAYPSDAGMDYAGSAISYCGAYFIIGGQRVWQQCSTGI